MEVVADLFILAHIITTKGSKDFHSDLQVTVSLLYEDQTKTKLESNWAGPTLMFDGDALNVHIHISANPPCAAGYTSCFVTFPVRSGIKGVFWAMVENQNRGNNVK